MTDRADVEDGTDAADRVDAADKLLLACRRSDGRTRVAPNTQYNPLAGEPFSKLRPKPRALIKAVYSFSSQLECKQNDEGRISNVLLQIAPTENRIHCRWNLLKIALTEDCIYSTADHTYCRSHLLQITPTEDNKRESTYPSAVPSRHGSTA